MLAMGSSWVVRTLKAARPYRIGCHAGWRGVFYPPGLRWKDERSALTGAVRDVFAVGAVAPRARGGADP
jgi:hypothetical protein